MASPQQQPAFQPQPSRKMKVIKTIHEKYALTNYAVANSQDFPLQTRYILVDNQFVFSISFDDELPPGSLGLSRLQRKWINGDPTKEIDVQPFDPNSDGPEVYLSTVEVEVGFMIKSSEVYGEFDIGEIAHVFTNTFNNQILSIDQVLVLDLNESRLTLSPKKIKLMDFNTLMNGTHDANGQDIGASGSRGVLTQQTQIQFLRDQDSNIRLRLDN